MPGFDGTGPMGLGPMTGGGRGFCSFPTRPVWPPYPGIGFNRHYTASWGGTPYYGMNSFTSEKGREEELVYLNELAQSMKADLKEIEDKIHQLENKKD